MDEEHGEKFEGLAARVEQAIALLSVARHHVDIYYPSLDRSLFESPPLRQAMRRLALDRPRTMVRILVADAGRPVHDCPQLVELVRRLPSHIEIRVLDPETPRDHPEFREGFVVVDERAVLHQHDLQTSTFWIYADAPRRGHTLSHLFASLWETGLGDPELRSLSV